MSLSGCPCSIGQTAAYLANNPNARYIAGAPGVSAPVLRGNLSLLRPINDFDAAPHR